MVDATGAITVVVPTLWRPEGFVDYICSVADLPVISGVIIIDNNHVSAPPVEHDKIKVLVQDRNVYVNPAWNLGAKSSSSELICFLNDDLSIKPEVFAYLVQLYAGDDSRSIGLIGLDWHAALGEQGCREIFSRDSAYFGCMMCLRTADYVAIPKGLKIWWGDEYLMQSAWLRKRKVLAMSGFALALQEGSRSVRDKTESFHKVLDRDNWLWSRIHRPLLYSRRAPRAALGHYWRKLVAVAR